MRDTSFVGAGVEVPVLNKSGMFEIKRVNPNTLNPPKEVVEPVHDYVPHEGQLDSLGKTVDCTVFAEKREKRTFSHPVDLTAYHGQMEFKVCKSFNTHINGVHIPLNGMYWKNIDYKIKCKTWYYIDNYAQFGETSDHDYIEIYRSYGGDFKKCRFRCDTNFFKIVQCFIFMNGLDKVKVQYGVFGLGTKISDASNVQILKVRDKSRLTVNMGGRRSDGKCHPMDPLKAPSSGDPLNIAEAIQCKCGVHAAFARAKRNGEMEYV